MSDRQLPEFRTHGFDAKFVLLTQDHLSRQPTHIGELVNFISLFGKKSLDLLKVLDFGCGRGELVGALRAKGARAHGIEIDSRFIESGKLLDALYQDEFPILSISDSTGHCMFPDGYFDVVVSDQVLEHVCDIDVVAAEIRRLLRPGGIMIHRFPAQLRPIEPHYMLPLVHWLPKSGIRRAAIKTMLKLGKSRQFFPNYTLNDRAEILFRYSVEETFYRRIGEVCAVFARNGINPSYSEGMKVYISMKRAHGVFRSPLGHFLRQIIGTFHTVVLTGRKAA